MAMKKGKNIIQKIFGNSVLVRLVAIVILALVFTSVSNGSFLSNYNLKNLLADVVPYLVMAMGVTFVLMVGSIDLSMGTLASAVTCVLAKLIPTMGSWAYPIALSMGVIGGYINGNLVARVKMPSFIATLSTMSIWSSVAYVVSGSHSIEIVKNNWNYILWAKTFWGVIPKALVFALILWVILFTIQHSTSFGKGLTAAGVNERAAQIAGVNVTRVKVLAFTLCGTCSALAGIALGAKLRGGLPTAGDAMCMLAIASAVLGGTALEGGKGGILNTLLGAAMVLMFQNGLNIIGVTSNSQDVVFGFLIIAAVFFAADRSSRHTIIK